MRRLLLFAAIGVAALGLAYCCCYPSQRSAALVLALLTLIGYIWAWPTKVEVLRHQREERDGWSQALSNGKSG